MDYNYTRIMNPQKKKQKQRGLIMYKYFLITIMSITMVAAPVYADEGIGGSSAVGTPFAE